MNNGLLRVRSRPFYLCFLIENSAGTFRLERLGGICGKQLVKKLCPVFQLLIGVIHPLAGIWKCAGHSGGFQKFTAGIV